ncbi:helix-turn-helix transcriptional regulator [Burkholderia multivorans]|uniref:helix-turn-helix transcriptional regulator n=1 Tax=Burkholderia multivorans TaxID=87883 RepID=UPI001C224945|nr:helix-turn-helix transcriptional regulator [Burkholderia multivorans]MBU9134209.1 helix-turn-helix transcriptional regulator [Burkholderia multivorans]
MTRIETIHQTIRHIYDAALMPDGWSRAGIALAHATASPMAILLNAQPATQRSVRLATGFDAACATRMQREFEAQPPPWIGAIPVATPVRQTACISDRDFARSRFYHDAVRPADGFYAMIAPLAADRRVVLAIGRHRGAADFTDDDVRVAQWLVPHVATALQVQRRIAEADLRAQGAYDAISRLAFGVILVDAAMRPLFANPAAEALARGGNGLLLDRNAVSAVQPADAARLRRTIAAAVALNAGRRRVADAAVQPPASMRCHVSRRPPRPPLTIRVVPVGAPDLPDGIDTATRAIVFVTEPDRPADIDPDCIATTFDLTPREAALAALLAGGMDLGEAAARLGIGIGTARGYLKQILAKTGTHRQAELVSLVVRAALPVMR